MKVIIASMTLCLLIFIGVPGIRKTDSSIDAKQHYNSLTSKSMAIKSDTLYQKIQEKGSSEEVTKEILIARHYGVKASKKVLKIQKNRKKIEKGKISFNSSIGPIDAPVTIEIFQDIKCGMCKYAYNNIIPWIKSNYVEQGKVKIVFREYPLIARELEMKLAEAAQCAGEQNKYETYLSHLYDKDNKPTIESIPTIAEKIGLDINKFRDCQTSEAAMKIVLRDRNAAKELGIEGTPAFYINGEQIMGAQPIAKFKNLIDSKLP